MMFKLIRKIFKLIGLCIVLLVLLAGITAYYSIFVEPEKLNTKEVQVTSDSTYASFTAAVFSDTHFGAGYNLETFQKAIDEINSKDVDFVFFLGDLIDNFNTNEINTAFISNALAQIDANYGKYAVFGNHDYGGGAENHYIDIMKNGGFTVLRNTSAYYPQFNLRITGADDFLIGYGDTTVVDNLSPGCFDFVLCHEPDVFDDFNREKIDLMTSGHSHGGQINIPFVKHTLLPSLGAKYVRGQYVVDDAMLYTNPGLGTTKIKARLFSTPEITYFTIN